MRKLWNLMAAALFATAVTVLAPQAAGATPVSPGSVQSTLAAVPGLTERVWHGGPHYRRAYYRRPVYRTRRYYRPAYYRPAYYRPCRLVRSTVWNGWRWKTYVIRRCY